MSDPAPTRRRALTYLTSSALAVGALIAGGGLMRSCAPPSTRTMRVDFSDMADGEMSFYTIGGERAFISRTGDSIRVLSGACPVDPPFGWIQPSFLPDDEQLYCPRCTSRFDRQGKITQFWSNRTPPSTAPNIVIGSFETDGLVLLVKENQSVPVLHEAGL